MILPALKEIGEVISEVELGDEWAKYYTSAKMVDTQAVVAIRLQEDADGTLRFDEAYLQNPEDPVDMARKYAYVNAHVRDASLTQRVAGSPANNIGYVLEWPSKDALGDARDEPVVEELRAVFDRQGDKILKESFEHFADEDDENEDESEGEGDAADGDGEDDGDPEGIEPSSKAPAFVTVELVDADGGSRWPGEIPAIREAIRNYYRAKLETTSTASGNTGMAPCTACGEHTDTYGAGAGMDKLYSLKRQGVFGVGSHNASEAWRTRPLCVDCITSIETAWDRFIDPQDYGLPGIRCKVIPYALPVEGSTEQLRGLIRAARADLIGTEAFDPDERDRPLRRAWDTYRQEVDLGVAEDALRLLIVHYRMDKSRANSLSWIDGVAQPHVSRIVETAEDVVETPAFVEALRPGGPPSETEIYVAPTERQVWTGMWAYNVLAREASRSGDDRKPADSSVWIDATEAMLTDGTLQLGALTAAISDEIRARGVTDRRQGVDRESEPSDPYYSPPVDDKYVARAYCFIRTLDELGILADDATDSTTSAETENTTTTTIMDTTNTTAEAGDDGRTEQRYHSLGEAVRAWIDEHETIRRSPGRTAAFAIGVMASQLSSWQQRRELNRTFLQSVSIDTVALDELPRMRNRIWDKSRTYNAQAGKYGTPWSDIHAIVDQAILESEERGWKASSDDVHTFFVMGTVAAPRLNRLVDDSGPADPTAEDAEGAVETETETEIEQ